MKSKTALKREVAELTQLIDDVASLFQKPEFYGVSLDRGTLDHPGIPFRDLTLGKVNKISPPPNLGRDQAVAQIRRGTLDVPRAIILKAHKVMRDHSKCWPEDEWIQLSPDWDLNLWMQTSEKKAATIYPMVAGQTLTSIWRTLLPVP